MHVIISSVMIGTVYAVLALGFSLMFGVARIINLAYTSFYMLAAYFSYVLCKLAGLNVFLSAFISVSATMLIGIAVYKFFLERIRSHETVVILISVSLAFLFEEIILAIFGTDFYKVPGFVDGYHELFGVRVLNQYFLAFFVSLSLIIGLWLFLSRTKLGIAIRATSQDREIVNVMGISERRVSLISVCIGIGFVAISSIFVSPIYVVEPLMWMHPIIMILAIVVLGGLGSLKGSLLAAYLLAFSEVAVVSWIPMGTFIKSSFALIIMVIVLAKRPEGMFGVTFEDERL
jgi:branched-chain amino acid transport system permease protein